MTDKAPQNNNPYEAPVQAETPRRAPEPQEPLSRRVAVVVALVSLSIPMLTVFWWLIATVWKSLQNLMS